jgi:1-acyl-sn-glycerol-3-phosphate acyltransferase
MGDGKFSRAIDQGKSRTNEIKGRGADLKARGADLKERGADLKARVPDLKERGADLKERGADLKERVPELRERGAELTARSAEELKNRGAELRTKGTELRARGGELARQYAKMDVSWARCGYARALREGLLRFVLGPMTDYYLRRRTVGREVFEELTPPVVFVANHSSHLDTPTILRAIPRKWRNRTAVAAAADYFYKKRWKANGVALLFNTVPLGRTGGGLANGATDHVDRLIGQGWNLVMFPEGTRSRDGQIGKVHSGAAVIAAHHGIGIVPIYVSGTHDAMPPGQNWPKRRPGRFLSRRHKVEVRFGRPIRSRDEEHRREVMDEVRAFWESKGLPAEADTATAPAAHDVLLIHKAIQEYEARHATQPTLRFEHGVPPAPEPSEIARPPVPD